jgi:hypothetical protein
MTPIRTPARLRKALAISCFDSANGASMTARFPRRIHTPPLGARGKPCGVQEHAGPFELGVVAARRGGEPSLSMLLLGPREHL